MAGKKNDREKEESADKFDEIFLCLCVKHLYTITILLESTFRKSATKQPQPLEKVEPNPGKTLVIICIRVHARFFVLLFFKQSNGFGSTFLKVVF